MLIAWFAIHLLGNAMKDHNRSSILAAVFAFTLLGHLVQAAELPAPTLGSPSNGATNVGLPATLSWSPVAGANAGYRVFIATSSSALTSDPTASTCGGCVINDTPAGTSDIPSGLQPATTYYWEVHGRSSAEYGTWSSINSFTTAGGGGSFSISASPTSQTVTQGQTATYTVTVQSSGGFSGPVSLSVLNLPGSQVLPGTGFSPPTVTLSSNGSAQSTLSIVTNSSTPTGTFSMTVQGTNRAPPIQPASRSS